MIKGILTLALIFTYGCKCSKDKDSSDAEQSVEGNPIASPPSDEVQFSDTDIVSVLNLSDSVFAGISNRATFSIELKYPNGTPVVGFTPDFSVDGIDMDKSGTCTPSNAEGVSVCENIVSSNTPQSFYVTMTRPATGQRFLVTIDLAEVGYVARPCGFDMNDNGIFGEPSDCDVCDGETLDPDGDGENEDLIYVDSVEGNDSTGTGTASSPYLTITKALAEADGPGDGREDIICLSGTFSESAVLTQSGRAVTATFNDVTRPSEPFLITGWDKDNDGFYPPFDTDDTAILDGGKSLQNAFDNNTNFVTHLEIAHLSVVDYDLDGSANEGRVFRSQSGANDLNAIFLHDIEASGIAEDGTAGDSRGFALFETTTGLIEHISIENVSVLNSSGHLFQFRCDNNQFCQRIHLLNINSSFKAANSSNPVAYLFQGVGYSTLERSAHDGNLASWTTDYSTFLGVTSGSQYIRARFNRVEDGGRVLSITADQVPSFIRPINEVSFEHNFADLEGTEAIAVYLSNPNPVNGTLGSIRDVLVRNNYFRTFTETAKHAVLLEVGNAVAAEEGVVRILGNSFFGNYSNSGIEINLNGYGFPQQEYSIVANVFSFGTVPVIADVDYVPSSLIFDFNTFFATVPSYNWLSTPYNFSDFLSNSTFNSSSHECQPSVDGTDLLTSDTCAKNRGTDLNTDDFGSTEFDFNGDTRPIGAPDIGADEIN